VTRELTRLNLQVSSAKISTYGEKVVDVFYVKNLFGHKIEHEGRLTEIRTTLEAVLARGNAPVPAEPPTRRARATRRSGVIAETVVPAKAGTHF
jgi:[protein-PII] uridylyltransferase